MPRLSYVAALLLLPAFAGCFHADPPPNAALARGCPQVENEPVGSTLWTIVTNKGRIVVELCAQQAPVTVGHIVNLTTAGKYAGASFYRIVGPSADTEKGFVIQGGLDRGAGAIDKVPDEFHHLLRHDREGTLSMAHAGPGSASSEFFITLDATPHLDDRHSVFGYVVAGLDVVHKIARIPTEANPNNPQEESKPTEPVNIESVSLSAHPDPAPVVVGVGAYAPVPTRLGKANDAANWAIVVRNLGTYIDNFTVELTAPEGWATSVDVAKLALPAGKGGIFLVSALPPSGTTGDHNVTAVAKSARNLSKTASVSLTVQLTDLGALVENGQRIEANYVGMLTDGRIFDTSLQRVADDPELLKMATQFTYRTGGYKPFNFTVGAGVIAGFTKLAQQTHVKETAASRIAGEDAYPWRPPRPTVYDAPLIGKPLVFELEVLKICATTASKDPC